MDGQEVAMFANGIKDLVLSFTDNEGGATNMCMVHIDPKDKKEIMLGPHMWRVVLKCDTTGYGETENC